MSVSANCVSPSVDAEALGLGCDEDSLAPLDASDAPGSEDAAGLGDTSPPPRIDPIAVRNEPCPSPHAANDAVVIVGVGVGAADGVGVPLAAALGVGVALGVDEADAVGVALVDAAGVADVLAAGVALVLAALLGDGLAAISALPVLPTA